MPSAYRLAWSLERGSQGAKFTSAAIILPTFVRVDLPSSPCEAALNIGEAVSRILFR